LGRPHSQSGCSAKEKKIPSLTLLGIKPCSSRQQSSLCADSVTPACLYVYTGVKRPHLAVSFSHLICRNENFTVSRVCVRACMSVCTCVLCTKFKKLLYIKHLSSPQLLLRLTMYIINSSNVTCTYADNWHLKNFSSKSSEKYLCQKDNALTNHLQTLCGLRSCFFLFIFLNARMFKPGS